MTGRQQSLDVVRGIAILSVVLFHLGVPTGLAAVDAVLHPFALAGWAGVDLFFVLSGYLVGGLVLDEVARNGALDLRRFFFRRALRLWPVLWVYLALLFIVGTPWSALWPVLFHVQNYAPHLNVPSHLWSLAVEEHFYLVAALLLPWLARRGGRPLVAALLAVIVGVTALRIAALEMGEQLRHAQWQTQYRIDALAVGVLLAVWRRESPGVFAWANERRGLLLAAAAIGFGWLATGGEDTTRYGIGLSVAWAASATLVLAAADATVSRRWAAPAAALAWLGAISYSLYVWHASAGQVAEVIAAGLGLTGAAVLVAKVGLAVIVGTLIHRWVERPALSLRDRRVIRKPAQVVVTTPI